MNIEIADRLQQLRKEKGYSQEDLANALGISRQAVSKWERAESSPDTDNLIMLAKLYDISLDELLKTDESVSDIKQRVEDVLEDNKKGGATFVDDDGSKATFYNDGRIHLEDGATGEIKDTTVEDEIKKKMNPVVVAIDGLLFVITIAAFLIVGFMTNAWHLCWILFLLYPFVASILEASINTHRLGSVAVPFIITAVYVYFGMTEGVWHPLWVIFFAIPAYYVFANIMDKYVFKTAPLDDED